MNEQITTIAELDALPVGSIAARICSDGQGNVAYSLTSEGWCMSTERIDAPRISEYDQVGNHIGPLTVLYRPDVAECTETTEEQVAEAFDAWAENNGNPSGADMPNLPNFAGRIRHLDMEVGIPLCVTLEEIEQQRAAGWPDWHPEDFCHRCGNRNISWATPAEVWDPVMRGGDHGSFGPWSEIVCIPCFIELTGSGKAWTLAYDENGTAVLDLLPQRVAPSEEEVARSLHALDYPGEPERWEGEVERLGELAAAQNGRAGTAEAERDAALERLAAIHGWANQIAEHFGDEWPHTPACLGEAGCPLCMISEAASDPGEWLATRVVEVKAEAWDEGQQWEADHHAVHSRDFLLAANPYRQEANHD